MGLNKIKEWQLDLSETHAKIEALGKAVTFKGRVDSVDQLPELGKDGDFWYVGPVEQENKEEYIWFDGRFELLGTTSKEDYNSLHNDLDELGDQVAEIESKIPESTSDTNPLINKQQLDEAIQGGGGGGSVPDNVYTEENFVAGENVTFDKKSGTDDNTVALFHFDGNAKDVVSGKELSENPVIATEGKFGTGSLKARENWFNSVSFAKSVDPKTTPFTLEFWHKQVKGSTAGTYGDETTIVLAPTAPNNTASKSQWVGLFMLPDGTNNKIQLQIGDSRLGEFRTGSYTTLGEYNHYALTWDPSTQYFKLYMNGTYVDRYQYYYYSSLPVLGGIGMFKYTTGTDSNTVAQAYIDELRISDTVRYTDSFTVATEAFPSDKLKTVVNVNVPEGGFNKDNFLGGKDIEIIPEPVEGGIDEHTVACWHFDGSDLDSVNNVTFRNGGGSYLTGEFGQAIKENNGNYVATSDYVLADKINSSENATVDCFLCFYQTSSTVGKLGVGGSQYSAKGYYLSIKQSDGTVKIYTGTTLRATTNYTFNVGVFYHIVLQKKNNIISVFINGVKILEYDASLNIIDFSGSGVYCTFFVGALDEFRISDVARYDGDFTPPTQPYRLEVPTGKYQINYIGESGAGKNIGEVYYSQSNSATDNAGALPLFTGETITSANTIYPDFYNWVTEHTELQTSIQEYNKSIQDFGECPKYVLNGSETRYYWTNASYTNLGWQCYTLSATPAVGDVVWLDSKTGTFEPVRNVASVVSTDPYTWAISNETLNGEPVTFTGTTEADGVVVSLDDGSLRLPKLANYIKMANTAEGITQKVAGLPNITATFTSGANSIPDPNASGAISGSTNTGTGRSGGTGSAYMTIDTLDASVSSAIYGNSSTVTPAHTTLYPWVYAYSVAIPASTAQAAEFQEGLSGKADTNLGNIPSNYDYVVETYNDGTNWYRVYKSKWIEQGGYSTGATTKTITFLKPFATETPTVTCTGRTGNIVVYHTNLSSTSFAWHDSATPESVGVFWRAEGQGA